MMRGTFKINNSNSLLYINKNYANYSKVSTQIALQQQVVDLEDNPLSANVGIKTLGLLAKSKQYVSNLQTGIDSLKYADAYIGSSRTTAKKVNDILIEAASDSKNQSQRAAYATEVNELLKALVGNANSNDGTRYVFGGQTTTQPPYTIVNGRYVNYTGNNKQINVVVDNNTTMPINASGSDVFGNTKTTIPSRDMNPSINMSTDNATRLSDLNGGEGVPKGKIMVYYSSYPDGLEVDLSGCDTIEDVKDAIESQTLAASKKLDTATCPWLDPTNLDWRDMQDRYVKVTVNPDDNGISLQEIDMGEPLPEPNTLEQRKGLTYSGGNYAPGATGISSSGGPTTVFDKTDANGRAFANLRVDDYTKNKVAEGLGIKGSAATVTGHSKVDGFLHGRDLNPILSDRTLLADIEGYNDGTYTFTNGGKPRTVNVRETTQDKGNVFDNWKLTGLSKGDNTGPNGELYARAVNRGTLEKPEIYVELYTVPLDKATSAHLVATGSYTQTRTGGTVILEEANSSGLSGSVGVILPDTVKEASISLSAEFTEDLQATVHVPAFVEEQNSDGTPRDKLSIASGWNITGLDKPPAMGYDLNHPASTDLDGNVSVNYRYGDDGYMYVELSRPAYGDQPAAVIATGKIHVGDTPTDKAVSGRVQFTGAEGFEGVGGSVYIELPQGTSFTDGPVGTGANDPTTNTYVLDKDLGPGQYTVHLGGATELKDGMEFNPPSSFQLTADTVFKKGQVFENDVRLPGGGMIRAGTPLEQDTAIAKGTTVVASNLQPGTVLPEGTDLTFSGTLPAGTVIPRGSYVASPAGTGFPSEGMGMSVTQINANTGKAETTAVSPIAGYDVQATFATIEDFKRAVEEAGIYVNVEVSADGKGLEFTSSLAGAWLTVSEDYDCYEQMGDTHQQLSGLNLNGLIKGQNSDYNGNVHTEVIYYPPPFDSEGNPVKDGKVKLISDSGEVIEIEPGYYVRVYSDTDQLNHSYENRDNSSMVAEGFIPAGDWNEEWLKNGSGSPFDPEYAGTLGIMQNLVLEERNDSGVWGHVDLNYYGDNNPQYTVSYDLKADTEFKAGQVFQNDVKLADGSTLLAGTPLPVDTTLAKGITVTVESLVPGTVMDDASTATRNVNYAPYNNDNITVYPGGLRPVGTLNINVQEVDIFRPTPGVNCDYNGTIHAKVTAQDNGKFEVKLYKDSSNSVLTAKSDPNEPVGPDGKVTIYEVDKYGQFATDANGDRIIAGSMVVDASGLNEGETESFAIKTGGLRNGGQEREENVFSTLNDIIDALQQNDTEKLHNLIGTISKDLERMDQSRADVASRWSRMELLKERHGDDQIRFQSTFNSRVGMDDAALSGAVMDYKAATEALQAAMQVSSTIMQMSLLQYL